MTTAASHGEITDADAISQQTKLGSEVDEELPVLTRKQMLVAARKCNLFFAVLLVIFLSLRNELPLALADIRTRYSEL